MRICGRVNIHILPAIPSSNSFQQFLPFYHVGHQDPRDRRDGFADAQAILVYRAKERELVNVLGVFSILLDRHGG